MKKILLLLTFTVLLAGLTSAVVNEVNYFKYAVVNNDGSVSYTGTPINNVNIVGYICSDSACSNGFQGNLWSGSVLTSGGSQMTLTYPTSNPFPNSYGAYIYKNGYIPWERGEITYNGYGNANPYTNYLAKKQLCTSEINSFDVSLEGNDLEVDANVQAPIENAGPLDFVPEELISHYSTKIDVTLEIKNTDTGSVVYTDTKQKTVEYSDDVDVSFSTSLNSGNYNVKVYTTLDNEAKCIDYDIDSKQKSISISTPTEPECVVDADCGEPSYGDAFCEEGDVHKILTTPVCVEEKCSTESIDKFIKWCEFGCSSGKCLFKPQTDCGNKKLNSGEECDDGNLINGDGCSSSCEFEDFCPLDEDDYDSVVVIDDLFWSDGSSSEARSSIIPLDLSSGEYSVTLVSRDYYANRVNTFQPNEQYKLSFLKEGSQVAITPETSDLGDYVSFAQVNEIVTENLFLPNGADSIQAVHAKYSEIPTATANSLTAVCAGINKNVPEPYCGDGFVNQGSEECDDGNNVNWDGCSAICKIEQPEPVCGDGVKEGNEQCDWGVDNGVVCDNSVSSCTYCSSECVSITLERNDRVPSIIANANTTSGYVPLSVAFTAQGIGGDGVLSYSWDFGDGSSSTFQNVNHVYDNTGTFIATATVTDEDGDTDSDSITIIVRSESSKKKSGSKGGSSCVPEWECYEWETCKNGVKTRLCYDLEDCDSVLNKPLEFMKCDSGPVLDDGYQTIGLGSVTNEVVNMEAVSGSLRTTAVYLSVGAILLLVLLLILLMLRRE